MAKFKVGDRVRRVVKSNEYPKGQEVVVVEGRNDRVTNAIWYVNEYGNAVWSPEENWELVAPTSPVRTVTRKEIVPGVYGRVKVQNGTAAGHVGLGYVIRGGTVETISPDLNAAELRAVAATFNELADALDEVA